MQILSQYKSEVKTVPFGGNGKTIIIENLTPILPPKERERRKKDIEKRLFTVFSKYVNFDCSENKGCKTGLNAL